MQAHSHFAPIHKRNGVAALVVGGNLQHGESTTQHDNARDRAHRNIDAAQGRVRIAQRNDCIQRRLHHMTACQLRRARTCYARRRCLAYGLVVGARVCGEE